MGGDFVLLSSLGKLTPFCEWAKNNDCGGNSSDNDSFKTANERVLLVYLLLQRTEFKCPAVPRFCCFPLNS